MDQNISPSSGPFWVFLGLFLDLYGTVNPIKSQLWGLLKKTIQCEEAFAIQLLVWQPINSLSIKLSEETHDCSINGTAGVPTKQRANNFRAKKTFQATPLPLWSKERRKTFFKEETKKKVLKKKQVVVELMRNDKLAKCVVRDTVN